MSAFVVDTDTMDRVVHAICSRSSYGQIIDSFAGVATNAMTADAPTSIGRALYRMNIRAVKARYPGQRDLWGDTLPWSYEFSATPQQLSTDELAAALKAMHCLRYQCSEGNVHKSKLFKELRGAIGMIAEEIAISLPAYNTAAWG